MADLEVKEQYVRQLSDLQQACGEGMLKQRARKKLASLLGNVQRIFQLKGWQVRKRPVGLRPRIQALLPSVAKAPDERWATDLCRVRADSQ